MPSLRDMMLQKQREEEQARQAREKALQDDKLPPVPPSPQWTDRVTEPEPVQAREITIDTLRGLYWLATPDHVGDKKMSRSQLKQKLEALLLSKDGMRSFLQSLEKFVFS